MRTTTSRRPMPVAIVGPNGPKPSKLLARPLGEARILVDEIRGRDVVDAGIAEDEAFDLSGLDRPAGPADYDAELALEHDASAIARRPPHDPVQLQAR
jgi:hypothetical protein